jgi:hypothetical protein
MRLPPTVGYSFEIKTFSMTTSWHELVALSWVGCNEDTFRIWIGTMCLCDLVVILLLCFIRLSGV